MSAFGLSAKAKGKQRAVDVFDEDDGEGLIASPSRSHAKLVTKMDLDGSSGDESDAPVNLSPSKVTPAKRARNGEHVNGELGSSVSRSARMRATTTEDEGGSGSDDEHEKADSSEDEIINELLKETSTRRAAGSRSFVTASNGEAYLKAMARPAKTSNKKWSDHLSSGRPFTRETYLAAIKQASRSKRAQETEAKLMKIEEAYSALHEQWAFELDEGFSIFFYGLGSKIRVLERFANDFLKKRRRKGAVITINGFMASLGIEDVLKAFEGILMPDPDDQARVLGTSAAKLDERANAIVATLNSSSSHYHERRPIYLLVHNIDGISLRSYRSQAILSLLASQPQIRVFASIDHAKAPLLFPSSIASARPNAGRPGSSKGYNAIYHHIPTHRPYMVETLLSGTLSSVFPDSIYVSDALLNAGGQGGLAGASSEARAKAASFVLASLTQKAKDVFALLAERQMSMTTARSPTSLNAEKTPPHATPYPTLFSLARDKFLANNVNQFEGLLREFRDHQIILSSYTRPEGADDDDVNEGEKEEVGTRGNEWLWIAIDREDLEGLLEK